MEKSAVFPSTFSLIGEIPHGRLFIITVSEKQKDLLSLDDIPPFYRMIWIYIIMI